MSRAVSQTHTPHVQILTVGASITNSGTISLPGQQDQFTMAGSVGQRLYFDTLDYDSDSIHAILYSPSGMVIFDVGENMDFGPFYLTEAGTNTLVLDGYGDNLGNYSFRMLDMSSAMPMTMGVTITNVLNPQSLTLAYSFAGTNGQRIVATNVAASSGNASWRLVSPAGASLFTLNIATTSDEIVLPETGTYVLLFEGNTASIGSLDFQARISLISNASGATSGFGTLRSGDTSADQTNNFSYTAPAGLWVYLDAETNLSPVAVYFIDPSNNCVICGVGGSADSGPYILPRSGTYTLRIVGNDIGSYKLRLLDLSNLAGNATPLTMGTTYASTLNPAYRSDVYRFTGTAGQRILYDSLDQNINQTLVYLFDPIGNNVSVSSYSYSDVGVFTLTRPGTYYLVQQGQSADNTNTYAFRLVDIAQPPTIALPLDTQMSTVMIPGLKADLYRFTGTNGQRLYFDAMPTNSVSGNWYLYGPNNQGLGGNNLSADFEVTLPQTGSYVLYFYGNIPDPVGYSFRVVRPNTVTSNLTSGVPVTGTLVKPGDEHRFTFTGTAGQRIFYDALDADYDAVNVYLYDPAGNNVLIANNADSDVGPFTLSLSGTYTILIKGGGDYVGDYNFRLLDIDQPPVSSLTLDTQITGRLNPGIAANLYRFNGTNGQRLYFDGMATNASGSWYLYGPNGQALAGNGLAADFEQIMPQTGQYVLYVYDSATNSVDYSFRVVVPNTVVSGLTLGGTVAGNLIKSGDEHRFTFAGSAGQRIFYDALDGDSDGVSVYLVDPMGNNVLIANNSDSDVGPVTLPSSGTYTILIKGVGDYVSDYSFRLLDVFSAPAITYGLAVTNQLSPQLQTQLYRINGTAGQHIGITNLAASNGNASWYLYSIHDGTLLNGNIATSLGDYVLPVSGTYVLGVEGSFADIGTLDYQFRVSLISSASGSASGFGINYCGDTTAGQTNTFTFNAPAGLPVYFDSNTNDTTVGFYLFDPATNLVVSFNGANDAGPYFLAASGTYTLQAIGSAAGAYCFRMLDLTSVTTSNMAFGTSYAATLESPFKTEVYRFTGTAGQRIFYDSLQTDLSQVSVYLYDPNGNNAFIANNSDYDSGPFTLSQPGTYYLAIQNLASATNYYGFRLVDFAQSPTTAVGFDTQVTGILDPPLQANFYRFTGTAGQRLFFDAMATNSGNAYWYLFSPYNQNLGGNALYGDFEVTLPQTGTYVLYLNGAGTDPLYYSIRVVTPNTTTNAYTIGTSASGSLDEAGEEDWFSFTGTAGQRLYYDALQGDYDPIAVTLFDPNGNNVYLSGNADSDVGPFTLNRAGTYLLRFKGNADFTNDYKFRILDAGTASTLALDTPVTNAMTTGFGAVLYQLPMLANLRLFYDDLGVSDGCGTHTVYGPQDQNLSGTSLGSDMEFTPALTGTGILVLSSACTNVPYTFQIIPGNHAPALAAIANRSVIETNILSFTATATDAEVPNDVLTWSLDAGAPAGATINSTNGLFTWTPTESQGPITNIVTIRVQDDGTPSFQDFKTFTITVLESNQPPVLTLPGNQVVPELVPLSLLATATDPDLPINTLTFALVSGPSGLTVSPGGAINWTPTEAQGPSTNTISISVTDTNLYAINTKSLSVTNSFQIVVTESNSPPALTLPANTVTNELAVYSAAATATDPDFPANPLTFALVSGPGGLTVSPTGGILWTPTEGQGPGSYTVTISVSDTNVYAVNVKSFSVTNSYQITVNEVNTTPTLPPQSNVTILESTTLMVTNTATDLDIPMNGLGYTLSGPAGASISTNGIITWVTTETTGPSTNTFTTIVTDTNTAAVNAVNLTATNTFTVVVNESNTPPVLTLPPNTNINELVAYGATATVTDADIPANSLTFALISGPGGLTVSPSGSISWTPTELQGPSTNTVTISVTDTNLYAENAKSLSVTNSYQIVVAEVNSAPALPTQTNVVINELMTLTVTNTATDPDNPTNTLIYSLLAAPNTATISANGIITWATVETNGPGTNTFTTRVVDNGTPALSATNTFNVVVNEVNSAPIVGALNNFTVNPGQTVSFTATATDSDIPTNALAFALVIPPAGAAISVAGAFTWRPSAAQANSTNSVTVAVTDNGAPILSGTNSFSVVVNPLAATTLTSLGFINGRFTFRVSGSTGPDYIVSGSTNLILWSDIFTNLSPTTPFQYTDTNGSSLFDRFYRVRLSP